MAEPNFGRAAERTAQGLTLSFAALAFAFLLAAGLWGAPRLAHHAGTLLGERVQAELGPARRGVR